MVVLLTVAVCVCHQGTDHYPLLMEPHAVTRNSEVGKRSLFANAKAELELRRRVEQHQREHTHQVARLDTARTQLRQQMEGYTARRRHIYQARLALYEETGDMEALGPYYRLAQHQQEAEPHRADVYQSGLIFHGLLFPGAFPHDVDSPRKRSYQNRETLKPQTLTSKGPRRSKSAPSVSPHTADTLPANTTSCTTMVPRSRSRSIYRPADSRSQTVTPWSESEVSILSEVPLSPNQYLVVMTPRGRRVLRAGVTAVTPASLSASRGIPALSAAVAPRRTHSCHADQARRRPVPATPVFCGTPHSSKGTLQSGGDSVTSTAPQGSTHHGHVSVVWS